MRSRPFQLPLNGLWTQPTARRAFHGMAMLATGSGASKLIALVSLPVITRVYTPDDMGALSVFAAFVMLLSPLLTLEYQRGLPVPNSDSAAVNLLVLCLGLVLGLSGIMAASLSMAAEPLLGLVSMETLLPVWWLLPLGTAIYAGYNTLQLWATRRRKYRVMAGAQVGQSLVGNGAKIGLAFVMTPPVGLLVGHVLAQGGGGLWLLARFRRDIRSLVRRIRPARILAVARRHRGFPLFRTPSQVILLLSAQAPVLFIASVFGPATAGQFGLAMMALTMPMNLIGRSMGKAFFGEAAHLGRSDPRELRRAVLSVTGPLAVVGAAIALGLMLAAPPLFPLVFGGDWDEAGRFAAILAIFLAFQFAAVPVMNILSVLQREAVYLQLDLLRLALVSLVFGAGFSLALSAVQIVVLYSVTMALYYIVCFLKVLSELHVVHERR